jgi:hypothetical protein
MSVRGLVRTVLACAAAGILIAVLLVAMNACCLAGSPTLTSIAEVIYPVLWPAFVLLPTLVTEPSEEYRRWTVAVLANSVPYGVIGAILYTGVGLLKTRKRGHRD